MNNKSRTKYDDDLMFDEPNNSMHLDFHARSVVSNIISVPIDEDIKSPAYYRKIVLMADELQSNDVLVFTINSPGGSLYGLLSLLSCIQDTQAHTVANIIGACSSSASILALHCDEVRLSPYSTMLVHNASYFGIGGKAPDVKGYIQHMESTGESLVRDTYKGFLTESEITSVLEGKDYWFNAQDIYTRLQNRAKYMQDLNSNSTKNTTKKPSGKNKTQKINPEISNKE